MSALSFLSKKSWHTGLQSNQEAVWKAEKAALEERKKLDELRKERERERELQELERLNEESGGRNGKRRERVDWMYQVPASIASSSSQPQSASKEELEEYLLGKKRVDKLLTKGDEGEKATKDGNVPSQHTASTTGDQSGTSAPTFGDVGSDRDVASKIREDPMFAIKRQEQAAYQALLNDPARLRAMRKAAGMDVGKDESKEERRRRKEEKRRRKEEEDYSRSDRALDRRDRRERDERYSKRNRDDDDCDRRSSRREERDFEDRSHRHSRESHRSHHDDRRQDRSNDRHLHRDDNERWRDSRHDRESSSRRSVSPSESRFHDRREHSYRSSSPRRSYRKESSARSQIYSKRDAGEAEAEREAKLAAMQKNAVDLSTSRIAYLAKVKEEEEANLKREEELRANVQKSRQNKHRNYGDGFGTEAKGSFLLQQERSLYGSGGGGGGGNEMDLSERLKRGRDTLQRFGDES